MQVVEGCAEVAVVVQTLLRLCKHSAAMTQVQLTPTDHPRLRTLLAFTIFLKTILSTIRIETRLLCLPLCLFPLQVSRSSNSGPQWHICNPNAKKRENTLKSPNPRNAKNSARVQCDLLLQLFNKHCQVPLESYFNSSPLHLVYFWTKECANRVARHQGVF